MRDRIRLLSLVDTATVLLLAGSAVLVVLGIFNSYLHWDLFSPEVVARDLDRAVHLALSGDTAWVEQMNRDPAFHWYHLIPGANGKNRAVLEIWGNENESFRDYEAGAKAAAKRHRA